MKRKEEDRIIAAAFGEQESASVETRNQVTLQEYRKLKADLALLNDIPEPQISSDRIRQAILAQGLKPSRHNRAWIWGLVPTAVAIGAFALIYTLPVPPNASSSIPASVPTVAAVVPFTSSMTADVFHPETEMTNLGHAVRSNYYYGSPRRKQKVVVAVRSPGKVKVIVRSSGLAPDAIDSSMVALSVSGTAADSGLPVFQPASGDAPSQASSASDTSSASPALGQKIIMVHQAQDSTTGAQTATEVDPTSNVVVGG